MKNFCTILIFSIMLVSLVPTYSQNSSLETFNRFCSLGDANKKGDYDTALFWYNKAKEYAIITADLEQISKHNIISALDWHKRHIDVIAMLCKNDIDNTELRTALGDMVACYGECSKELEVNNNYAELIPLIIKWEEIIVDTYEQLGRDYVDRVLLETITQIAQDKTLKSQYHYFWRSESLLATKFKKIKLYIKQHDIKQVDAAVNEFMMLLEDFDKNQALELWFDAGKILVDHLISESYYVRAKDLCLSVLAYIYQEDNPISRKEIVEFYESKLGQVTGIYLGETAMAYEVLTLRRTFFGPNEDDVKKSYSNLDNYISDQQILSNIYQQWYDFDNALYHAKCAYDAFVEKDEASKNLIDEMYFLSSLGDIYRALKRYDEAEDCLKKAIDIYETHYKDSIVDMWPMPIYMHLGNLYFDKQDFASAKEILHKVYNYCEKNEPNKLDAPALYLAEIYIQEDNYIEAKKYLTISWESFMDSAQAQLKTMTPNERSLFWGQYWGFVESYGGRSITAMPYYDDIYYNILLHWKSLLLRTDLDIDLFVRNSNNYDLKELYLRMRRETDPQRKSGYEKDFAYLISSLYPDNSNIIEWQDVQKALKKKEVAIEFAECWQKDSKQYAALILRKDWDAPKMVVLCDDNELKSMVKLHAELTKNKRLRKSENKTKELIQQYYEKGYQLIWSKLEPYINEGDKVYFSPAGLLHQMNIEVLQDENGRLANEKYELHRVSSTRELCIERPKIEHTSAVLYGGLKYNMDSTELLVQSREYSQTDDFVATRGFEVDPTFMRDGLRPLNGAEDEVNAISKNLNEHGIETTIYIQTAGTEESFKALSGKRTPIIHLATHGFFYTNEEAQNKSYFEMLTANQISVRPDNSLKRSGLIMAGAQRAWDGKDIPDSVEDGILLAEEIATMDLSGTDLVVLSACETGLGEITSEGVFGLQRAFKKAGVQTLIMSLWKVHDAATKLMMTTFYKEWLSGKSKHEAFTIAQRTVRSTNGYENPYFWASFIMLD